MRPICKNRLIWPEFTKVINRLIIEDDSNCCSMVRDSRTFFFIVGCALYYSINLSLSWPTTPFSLFSPCWKYQKRHILHFEVFFSIADSYDCVKKNCMRARGIIVFFSKIQLVGQRYRDKTTEASKTRFSRHCFGFQSRCFSLLVGYNT